MMFAEVVFRVLAVLKQQPGCFQEPAQRVSERPDVTIRKGHTASPNRVRQATLP